MTLTFINNIPLEHLALKVSNNGRHVSFKDSLQLRRIIIVCGDPRGELRVPGEGVSTDLLVILLGPVHQGIGRGEIEDTGLGLNSLPLDTVLVSDLGELLGGSDSGIWSILVENPLIYHTYQKAISLSKA